MSKYKLTKLIATLLCAGCIAFSSQAAEATEYPDNYTVYDNTGIYLNTPYITLENFDVNTHRNFSMKKNKSKITWTKGYYDSDDNIVVSYDFQIATQSDFSDAQTMQVTEPSITLKKKQFGKNGGIFYVRVRTNYNDIQFSEWSEPKELVYTKINKTNFPGLYDLLKNGGKKTSVDEKTGNWGIEKVIYDINTDGWLDPNEIELMHGLFTMTETYQKNGKWYTIDATKVSSLKGVEYLKCISTINLAHYSGKTIDLSNNPQIFSLDVRGITSNEITVISPTTKTIMIEPSYSNKNFTTINLSDCPTAVSISAYGNAGTPNLKLPKVKTSLKELSVSDLGLKTLDLNSYTNLQLLYIYKCQLTSLKINKCSSLRYLYFWHCDNIKSLDLSSNKKLTGLSVYHSPGLTTKSIKAYKNAKKATINTEDGKWWYGTDEYQKLMSSLLQ